ncbi:MAG TPA: hypothetical protein EYM52_10600 [Dehalococcoidia bacterium]|nr:hypothetical protein [Dehalococcoidia bacterium]
MITLCRSNSPLWRSADEGIHSAATINASPEAIWQILTDAPAYPDWEPGTIRVEGRVALGEKIKISTKLSLNRAFSQGR